MITRVALPMRDRTCWVDAPVGARFFRAGVILQAVEQAGVDPQTRAIERRLVPVEVPVLWAEVEANHTDKTRRFFEFVRDGEEPTPGSAYVDTMLLAGGSVPIHVHEMRQIGAIQ
jgi:hypothetical protein